MAGAILPEPRHQGHRSIRYGCHTPRPAAGRHGRCVRSTVLSAKAAVGIVPMMLVISCDRNIAGCLIPPTLLGLRFAVIMTTCLRLDKIGLTYFRLAYDTKEHHKPHKNTMLGGRYRHFARTSAPRHCRQRHQQRQIHQEQRLEHDACHWRCPPGNKSDLWR